jgi:hypothetical protein
MSRDSVVGTATGYGLDDRGVGVRVPSPRLALGHTQSLIQWVTGFSPGGEAAGA